MEIDLQNFQVEDSPNSAEWQSNAICCCKLRTRSWGKGARPTSVLADFSKHPAGRPTDDEAYQHVEEFIAVKNAIPEVAPARAAS